MFLVLVLDSTFQSDDFCCIVVSQRGVKGMTIALDVPAKTCDGVSWQCFTSWSQYFSLLWDQPKDIDNFCQH